MNKNFNITEDKLKIIKIIILIILSNILFFMIFAGHETDVEATTPLPTIPSGYALLKVNAQLHIPFTSNTPISIWDKQNNLFYNKARLWEELKNDQFTPDINGQHHTQCILLVPENDIPYLIHFKNIIIYPFLKNWSNPNHRTTKGHTYEIHY